MRQSGHLSLLLAELSVLSFVLFLSQSYCVALYLGIKWVYHHIHPPLVLTKLNSPGEMRLEEKNDYKCGWAVREGEPQVPSWGRGP